jgi:hypothetical protein
MKVLQSFEILEVTDPMTKHDIPEDFNICRIAMQILPCALQVSVTNSLFVLPLNEVESCDPVKVTQYGRTDSQEHKSFIHLFIILTKICLHIEGT